MTLFERVMAFLTKWDNEYSRYDIVGGIDTVYAVLDRETDTRVFYTNSFNECSAEWARLEAARPRLWPQGGLEGKQERS